LLFLVADTGGGHGAAASAVSQALMAGYAGRFDPVECDPLGGPRAHRLLQRFTGLYGPVVRRYPQVWAAAYYAAAVPPALRLAESTLFALADGPVADATRRWQPAAIVSFHPLLGHSAVRASRASRHRPPVFTVVTDLVTVHRAWQTPAADTVVLPMPAVDRRHGSPGFGHDRCIGLGLPVRSDFWSGPIKPARRRLLRRTLNVDDDGLLIVVVGGAEGAGDIAAQVSMLVSRFPDVSVVAVCGRNVRARQQLQSVATPASRRLRVHGFVDDMAAWMHAADVLVTKAGPSTIAEATSCGVPLVLTSHLPGQERGNIDFVVRHGAGRHAPTLTSLSRVIEELRGDRDGLAAMRAASARLGRPTAAIEVADLIATTVSQEERARRSA
jgi:1,2-diacylglycerol 3-beta-galactosyltransferase